MPRRPSRPSRKVEIDTVFKIVKFMQSIDAIFAIPVWLLSLYFTSFYSLWLMIPVTSLLGLYLYDTVENYRWALDMAKSLARDAMARTSGLVGSSARARRTGSRSASPVRKSVRGRSPGRQSGWGGALVAESLLPSMRYGSGNSVRKPEEGGEAAKGGARGRSPGRPPGSPNKVHNNPKGNRRGSRGR